MVSIQKGDDGSPKARAEVMARKVPAVANTGVYDTAAYDDEVEYG